MANGQEEDGTVRYRCSRCGGVFAGAVAEETVLCPYCAMICEEAACRLNDSEPGLLGKYDHFKRIL